MVAIPPAQSALSPAAREELRESYADLRSITASVQDPAVRARLAMLEQRLAALSRGQERSESPVHLSPREIDVLACAALGGTNAQIAVTLALKEATIKSYLQAAMAKLDASTRHAAVIKARRARPSAVAPAVGWPRAPAFVFQTNVIGRTYEQEKHSIVVEAESNLDRHLEVVDAAFLDVPSH